MTPEDNRPVLGGPELTKMFRTFTKLLEQYDGERDIARMFIEKVVVNPDEFATRMLDRENTPEGIRYTFKPMVELLIYEIGYIISLSMPEDLRIKQIQEAMRLAGFDQGSE